MKKIIPIPVMLCALLLAGLRVNAQTNDTTAIKEASINYVEGFYTGDGARMEKALSPELVKRIIMKDPAGDAIQNMSCSLLVLSTRRNKNAPNPTPNEPFKANVIIYDIGTNIATVKIVTNKFKFIDYAQLGRINGEWKIVNVLWEFPGK